MRKFKCNSYDKKFSSGSTIFGDTLNDTHEFTGSLLINGSLMDPDPGSLGRIGEQ